MGLDYGVAAVAVAYGMGQILHGNQVAQGINVCHDGFTAFLLGHAGVLAGLFLHDAVFINNLYEFQIVVLAQGPVVMVMAGRDLEGAGAEGHVHVLVGNNGQPASQYGQDGCFAYEMGIALVIGMDADSRIAGDGLGPGCGYDNALVRSFYMVADFPELALFVSVLDLVVGQGRMAAGAPVDDVLAAVDKAFVVELDKDLAHCL